MAQPILELGNTLNWDVVTKQTYISQYNSATEQYIPIKPKTFAVDKRILVIGCKNDQAPLKWYKGCYVSQLLLAQPTSYNADQFTATMQTDNAVLIPLNVWRLVRFEEFNLNPYLLHINIPHWHRKFYIEIWKYSGADSDTTEQILNDIFTEVTV